MAKEKHQLSLIVAVPKEITKDGNKLYSTFLENCRQVFGEYIYVKVEPCKYRATNRCKFIVEFVNPRSATASLNKAMHNIVHWTIAQLKQDVLTKSVKSHRFLALQFKHQS